MVVFDDNGAIGAVRDNSSLHVSHEPLESMLPRRVERLLDTLASPERSVLLLGEPGSGKNRLAEEVAYGLEQRIGQETMLVFVPPPSRDGSEDDGAFESRLLAQFGVTADPDDRESVYSTMPNAVAKMRIAVQEQAQGRPVVVVAPGVDRYPAWAGILLAGFVKSSGVRLVATARHLSGAAERLSRDPRVSRVSVGPLNHSEAKGLLTRLLGCSDVEYTTLHRWHEVTNGYAHSLTVLALALDRRGLILRDGGMIWEAESSSGVIPDEFLSYLETTCTPDELETLETVALVAPITEPALVAQLAPEHLRSLQSLGLVVPRLQADGHTALTTSHELLTTALRERMSPERRKQLSFALFVQLRKELSHQEPSLVASHHFRMVTLGLEAERALPITWLVGALSDPRSDTDPETKLRIAYAVVRHSDAMPKQVAEAAVSVCESARLVGKLDFVSEAAKSLRDLLDEDEDLGLFPARLRVRMQLERITHLTLDMEQFQAAGAIITELERDDDKTDIVVTEMVRCARTLLYARTGQPRLTIESAPAFDDIAHMELEWVRGSARLASSLVGMQQGRFAEAINCAEQAHSFATLGSGTERFLIDRLALAIFVEQWASGATQSARDTLRKIQHESLSRLQNTGFVDVAYAALALNEGRWQEAAQRARLAHERHTRRDPYGVIGLVCGVLALSLAALGERTESRLAIVKAEVARPGTSQMLRGIIRILTLEARLWNEEPDFVEHANKTIDWAKSESLAYIELRSLQLLAGAQNGLDSVRLASAKRLAAEVDAPMGVALLEFIEEANSSVAACDSPAARMLTDLGVWVPLPRTPLLSVREREIALHAALGYSSRWIADHFFLSVRTVETHLRHVFTKLGVTGRDELRAQLRSGRIGQ